MASDDAPVGYPFLADGGELGARMRAHDWSSSPLGPPSVWPHALRSLVGVLLTSKFPMFVAWGDALGFLYNNAYAEILGDKHPSALGARFADIWSEIWSDISPLIEAALGGEGIYRRDLPLVMTRKGYEEQTWFTFSYSPVRDESGAVAGMFCACAETTEKVLAERRLSFLVELSDALQAAKSPVEVTITAAEALGAELGVTRTGYGEIVDGGEVVHVERDWASPGAISLAGEARLLDAFGPAVIEELRAGRVLVVEDCDDDARTADPTYLATWRSIETRALIVAPLLREGRLSAILYAHSAQPRRWTADEVAVVGEVASRTWSAHVQARAEVARSASERRLRLAHKAAELGDFTWDVASGAATFSERYERLLGLPAERLPQTAQALFAMVHEGDAAAVQAAAVPVLRGEARRFDTEFRIRRGDGHTAWLAVSAQVEGGGDQGAPEQIVGVSYDITDRKRAEEALRESESRFRLMADAVPQIVWITDAEGRTEFFNRQWSSYTGAAYEPSNAAEIAAGFVHPEDAAATMAAFEQARRTGTTFQVEHRIRSADGDYKWFLVRAEPYRDSTGAVVRWFGASVDIHDRKAAEQALRDLNADLERQIVERAREQGLIWRHSIDLLSVIDLTTGVFDAVNPAWSRELGWSLDELAGRPFSNFLHPDDYESSAEAFEHLQAGRPVLHFQNRCRTKSGDWRWLSWIAVPEGGKLYSVTRDITVEKARQAELDVAQEALRQAQKMEAMGQLTGGVAHDFNNLLTPIVGALDRLQTRGLGDARDQRLIAGAMQSAERAKTLVQRLLAFARRQPLQSVAVDVAGLVAGMAELVSSTTGPQIRVVVDAPEDLPPALADPNQLEMALLNLAVNARDAMPDGGVLRISAFHGVITAEDDGELRPGRYVRLSVADTGTGMDEATLARAIEPFFSTKGIGKGTGLGLSMVHGLASQLGGALRIKSQPGLGTNVELWLPVSALDRPAGDASDTVQPSHLAGRGVALLVDDEEVVRLSTADMLLELGYSVIEASSAEDALRVASGGGAFDLLVTDHLMPGLNGAELARELRTLRPTLPVLIVSGYAEAEGVSPDLPRLTKPFRKAELAAALALLA